MKKINITTVKKVSKIALSIIAFASFLLIFAVKTATVSHDIIINNLLSNGSGISATSSERLSDNEDKTIYEQIYKTIKNNGKKPYILTLSSASTLPKNEGQDPDAEITTTPIGYPVVNLDMSGNQTKNNLQSKNESKYSPDINTLSKLEYPIKYSLPTSLGGSSPPLVLIVHTHGTECYLPEGNTTYTDETPTRTKDTENNVVAIGKVFAQILNDNGIKTIHCETMFDEQSYSKSYDLSEKAIIEYLEQYPSIRYVFDIHRDSVMGENNEKIKSYAVIDGSPSAQAMFVVGTDSSGADHPDWIENLTVASIFQSNLVEKYPSLMRPINIRSASFNAEHATGSILIEIGTCGNTLSEAKLCAELLAQTIADVIKSQ